FVVIWPSGLVLTKSSAIRRSSAATSRRVIASPTSRSIRVNSSSTILLAFMAYLLWNRTEKGNHVAVSATATLYLLQLSRECLGRGRKCPDRIILLYLGGAHHARVCGAGPRKRRPLRPCYVPIGQVTPQGEAVALMTSIFP